AKGQWWVPLLDGTERLGVLRVGVPGAQVEADKDLNKLAGLVALLLVSKRDTSDSPCRPPRLGSSSTTWSLRRRTGPGKKRSY
ncbi:stage II sporulation protein E, partial [Streptomyces sp900116325]